MNECCICLPYSKFTTKECHCSFAVVQINVNKFTFLGHLVPVYPWLMLNAQCP